LWSRLWPFGPSDVIGHVITGFPMCGFLLVVNMNRPCFSHGCRDIELQRYLGHDLDLLGSHDVICRVIIGFAIWRFLQVVNLNRPSISHGFWVIKLQRHWGHNLTFRVTWRHRSCDDWIHNAWFPIGSQYELTTYLTQLSTCRDIELQRYLGHDLDLLGSHNDTSACNAIDERPHCRLKSLFSDTPVNTCIIFILPETIESLIYMKAAVILIHLYLLLRNSFRKPSKGVQNER